MSDLSMKLLVSDTAAAAMMGCGRSTFAGRVKRGQYPAPVKDGSLNRWKVADLEACRRAYGGSPVLPKRVPLRTGACHLYRHYDLQGRLLYVGISLSAIARLADHKKTAHWFWQIARIDVAAYATREDALKAEGIAILQEKPLHNIRRREHE